MHGAAPSGAVSRTPHRPARGAQVAWREAGDTASDFAVVMLHGISSGAASWMDVALALAPRTRVLAWGAPGYGRSTPLTPAAPTGADYARVLEQSLQALGVRRCLLVGHSLGALMGTPWAVQAGAGRVQQLVLISPAGGYGAPGMGEQQAKVRQGRLAALQEKASKAWLPPSTSAWSRPPRPSPCANGCAGTRRACMPQATPRPWSCCAAATWGRRRGALPCRSRSGWESTTWSRRRPPARPGPQDWGRGTLRLRQPAMPLSSNNLRMSHRGWPPC